MLSMPPEAAHEEYDIQPLASADNLNKEFVYRKKVERFQLLRENQHVNQHELVKDVIAAGDPQDVKKLLMDGESQASQQAEDQAVEVNSMLIGFPSQVKPVDDDAIHLNIINGFVARRLSQQEEISPELAKLLVNHANLHFRQLQTKNPDKAAELDGEMQKLAQYLGSIVGEAEAEAQMQQQAQQLGVAPGMVNQ